MIKATVKLDILEENIGADLLGAVDKAFGDNADRGFQRSQELITEQSFDEGTLLRSGHIIKTGELERVISYEALHACVAYGKTSIIMESGNKGINWVKEDEKVLSKDGEYHKVKRIFKSLNITDKPTLILLKTKKHTQKKGLLITEDHLILTLWDGIPIWKKAGELKIGDFVFRSKKIGWNDGTKHYINCICIHCGKHYQVPKGSIMGLTYCSPKCYHEDTDHNHSEGKHWNLTPEQKKMRCGENNAAWKGGTSKFPYGPEWNQVLRDEIRERDNYICQECGIAEKGYAHDVHHIDGDKFNNSENNLILLCHSCHAKQQWQDAELVVIDIKKFEITELIEVRKIDALQFFNPRSIKRRKLYDLGVEGENSFIAGGILIHNSYIEFGATYTDKMPPLQVIYEWVRRKKLQPRNREALQPIKSWLKKQGLITSTKTKDSDYYAMAFYIAKDIKEHGLEARPFARPMAAEMEAHIEGDVRKRIKEVVK